MSRPASSAPRSLPRPGRDTAPPAADPRRPHERPHVVFATYHFAPRGGIGSIRATAFARGLLARGWDVTVVTTAAPPRGGVGPHVGVEPLPEKRAQAGLEVVRVSASPRRFRLPAAVAGLFDPFCCEPPEEAEWARTAVAPVREALVRRPGSLLYVGAQPYSAAALGTALAEECGVRWVLDLADPWVLDEARRYRSVLHYLAERRAFLRALGSADRVVANTPDAAHCLARAVPSCRERLTVVTNGFDRSLMPLRWDTRPRGARPFTLCHLGMLGPLPRRARWNPLRFRPYATSLEARGPRPFLAALAAACSVDPRLAHEVRLVVVGPSTPGDLAAVEQAGLADRVAWTGMLPHAEALREAASADLMVLLQQAAPAGHRVRSVRAKLYEYMGLRKPLLACVPEGDGCDFAQQYGGAYVCAPDDVGQIAEALLAAHRDWRDGREPEIQDWFVDRFEREALVEQLDGCLRTLREGRVA